MRTELEELLVQGLEEIGLTPGLLLEPLRRYFEEILQWNPRLGLVKATERELIVKHFLDSAAAYPVFADVLAAPRELGREEVDVGDLGSGVGLPGIMLALMFRERAGFRVHLVEKQERRCSFLRRILPALGLDTLVCIHRQRAETLELTFDIVTSRAFSKLSPAQRELQSSLLKPGGKIVAYKGRLETVLEELGGGVPAGGSIIPLRVPFLDAQRHLVVLSG